MGDRNDEHGDSARPPRKVVGRLRDEDPLRRLERLNEFVRRMRPAGAHSDHAENGAWPIRSALAALSRADADYVVVGGVACALSGHVRTTDVVELLVDAAPANIRRLLDALAKLGEGYAREPRDGGFTEDFIDEEGAIRLVEDFPIDLFTRLGGRRYADMLPHRRVLEGDAPIPYVDAAGLILLKASSRRPQDRIDVEALRRL